MNRILCTFVTASVLVSGAAYGQSKPKTTHDKQTLKDTQMDKVTAAGEENSSIAANNSHVTEDNTGTVSLAGTALMGASGVNIVNSSDALVGNGVNVYDATWSPGAFGALSGSALLTVKQSNDIDQDAFSEASLEDYHRGQNSQTTIVASENKTKNNTFTESKNASFNHTTTNNFSATETRSSSTTNNFSENASLSASKTKTAAATLGNTANLTAASNKTKTSNSTLGFAAAGAKGTATNAGPSTTFTNSATGGGATSAGTGTTIGGAGQNVTGPAVAANATDNTSSTASKNLTASDTFAATANKSSTASLTASAAKSDVFAHSSMSSESVSDQFATNTTASLVASKSDTFSSTDVKNLNVVHNVQGAVSFDDATAKNIAVDGSTINDTNTYSVTLAGAAEQNASALNIVNAAGGLVANGVNVAHTTNVVTAPINVTQSNTISQAR
jgi:hypothetical protein